MFREPNALAMPARLRESILKKCPQYFGMSDPAANGDSSDVEMPSGDELDMHSDEESSEEEPTLVGAVPSADTAALSPPVLGCRHYVRGARIIAPCCGEEFWCRLCHDMVKDEGETDPKKQHKIVRFLIEECVCAGCGLWQPAQQACRACGLIMGAYYCAVCKFWENTPRGQYHCEKCGICRCVALPSHHRACCCASEFTMLFIK
jgi:hypothetical protein